MRPQTLSFVVASLVAASIFAASAFNSASTGSRDITIRVQNDNVAYIALERNGASPHKCYVTQTSTAKIAVDFSQNDADAPFSNGAYPNNCWLANTTGGTGINEGSWYEFADIINITNLGTKTVTLYINNTLTCTSGSEHLQIAVMSTKGTADTDDYAPCQTKTNVAPGGKFYIGLRILARATTSGNTVTNEDILVEAEGNAFP